MCYLQDKCKKFKEGKCDESQFCQMRFKIDKLFELAQITNKQKNRVALQIDADGTDEEAFTRLFTFTQHIEEFVERGTNLYISSKTCGNGKTAWALRFCQEYINKIWYKSDISCKVLFIDVSKFMLALKNNISEKDDYATYIKENVDKADLVVWDDIATKTATTFELEYLLSLINSRLNDSKSNIFTSNVLKEELFKYVGERLASRIIGLSENIEFKGSDKRGTLG